MFCYAPNFHCVLEWTSDENSVRNLNSVSHLLILFTGLVKRELGFSIRGPCYKVYIPKPSRKLKGSGWQCLTNWQVVAGNPRDSPQEWCRGVKF